MFVYNENKTIIYIYIYSFNKIEKGGYKRRSLEKKKKKEKKNYPFICCRTLKGTGLKHWRHPNVLDFNLGVVFQFIFF